jgi:ribonuclease P protein component
LASGRSNRFQKPSRLLNAAAFARVFEKATRSRDELFTVLWRRNDEDRGRLGLAISKKLCRRATARNRIKRVIRESFRQHQELLAGLDVVVINRAAAASADNTTMAISLDRHWGRCAKTRRQDKTQTTHAGKHTDG